MKSIIKSSPFWGDTTYIDTDSVFSQMDNVFQDVFGNFFDRENRKSSLDVFERSAYPRLDIRDESTQYVIDIEVPGLTREDVKVEVKNGVLIVRGEKCQRQQQQVKEAKYIRKELKKSSFSRQICSLSDNCDVDKILAAFKDGLLTVTIPKKINDQKSDPVKQINIS